jgi:Rps23 Pro-64 3,4-dihydroxylase Tpa1-like proline 4-hydroxylase
MYYKKILSEKYYNLDNIAKENLQNYKTNKPFPNIFFDNFFNEDFLFKVRDEFPDLSKKKDAEIYNNNNELKLTSNSYELFEEHTRSCFDFLNSKVFLKFLNKLTSIEEGLISDPYLSGGGLHEIKKGGLLKIHTDFNKHGQVELDRRLNVIVYLNPNWKEDYGGHLEFWDKKMKAPIKKILPIFNRLAIFSTNDFTNHGHPEALSCPEDMSRKSLALFYFSNGRPKNELVLSRMRLGTFFKDREGIKGDVDFKYSKVRHFLMRFAFYQYLRHIRDKFFKKN